jgi:hypothetical protein
VVSEAGNKLKIILPWKKGSIVTTRNTKKVLSVSAVEMPTAKGETLLFRAAD